MSELRQRRPRLVDEKYLARIRELPCCVCGAPGPSDAAHIRCSDAEFGGNYDKTSTGMSAKPNDNWAVPLCRPRYRPDPVAKIIKPEQESRLVNIGCHGRQHGHQTNFIKPAEDQATRDSIEVRFWKQVGKNPFMIAATLYAKFGTELRERKKKRWKPAKDRPRPKQKIINRGFDKTVKRKLNGKMEKR